ncbi:protein of unknown function [Cupriavidus taiwanensis]|nr:hypothetical protein CBM2597_A51090 [Cupriavidus taiwanensis]SPD39407.1 protein of unknown function [Cupriavidus taiwanensis]
MDGEVDVLRHLRIDRRTHDCRRIQPPQRDRAEAALQADEGVAELRGGSHAVVSAEALLQAECRTQAAAQLLAAAQAPARSVVRHLRRPAVGPLLVFDVGVDAAVQRHRGVGRGRRQRQRAAEAGASECAPGVDTVHAAAPLSWSVMQKIPPLWSNCRMACLRSAHAPAHPAQAGWLRSIGR